MPGKPKPSKMKIVQGTFRKDRANRREPKLKPGLGYCPRGVSERARRYWPMIGHELLEMGVMTKADRFALVLLVEAFAEFMEMREIVEREGSVYECGKMLRQRPEVVIAADAWKRVRGMLTEFGLTPSSRTRVMSIEKEKPEKDPWEQL